LPVTLRHFMPNLGVTGAKLTVQQSCRHISQ